MAKVLTTDGAVLKAKVTSGAPLTAEQAESICKQANKKAEKLGIKTRYEVTA